MLLPFRPEGGLGTRCADRKSTRLNSSHVSISYAVFCSKKKNPHEEPREHLGPGLPLNVHGVRMHRQGAVHPSPEHDPPQRVNGFPLVPPPPPRAGVFSA